MKCKDCSRYGDLHSSCDKARYLQCEPDDVACENFKCYKSVLKEIIKALRCSATPGTEHHDCEKCRYRYLEPVDDKIPCRPDVEIAGVKYWESCDCDRICMDAAELLEKQ